MFIHIKRMCKNPHKRFALHILSAPAKSIFTLPPNILLFIFATLVSYCAGCLTCRLARCLALSASTLFNRLFIVSGCQCLNMFHSDCLLQLYSKNFSIYDSISHIFTFEKRYLNF